MKTPLLLSVLCALVLLLLPSCADPNYYGSSSYGSSYYGSSSYSTLPYGYNTVHVSGVPYYYYGNSWYRRSSGRYISCSRPHGYHGSIGHSGHHYNHGISRLPHGYRSVTVGDSRYYNHGSNWYRKSGSRYVTCARPTSYRSPQTHYRHNTGSSYRYSKTDHRDRDSSRSGNHRSSSGSKTYVKPNSKHRSHFNSASAERKSSPYVSTQSRPTSTPHSIPRLESGRSKNTHSPSKPFNSRFNSAKDKSSRR